ncbi:MAG: glycosyltransferase family 9 protein, partial [Ramlibacter sp.]
GCVALVHGTSRDDKCWPEPYWIELATRLTAQGFTVGLPHGGALELARSERITQAVGASAQVWPRMDLGQLTDRLAACTGVIGVDSGLSHIAVALALAHVQIYNFDTAWRTGPLAPGPGQPQARQRSVFAQPTPSIDAVWQAWEQVAPPP